MYFLQFNAQKILKLEFTYYPFVQIESPIKRNGLLVDSVIDIATNKLFTIVQNPRGRDYYDLYSIIQTYHYPMEKLRKLAKLKFDWDVDVLQLGTQFNTVAQYVDDPILTNNDNRSRMIDFFKKEAIQLKSRILTK